MSDRRLSKVTCTWPWQLSRSNYTPPRVYGRQLIWFYYWHRSNAPTHISATTLFDRTHFSLWGTHVLNVSTLIPFELKRKKVKEKEKERWEREREAGREWERERKGPIYSPDSRLPSRRNYLKEKTLILRHFCWKKRERERQR